MKTFFKNNIFFIIILFIGSIFHISFLSVNEILKNADSFAYLQMSYHFQNFSLEWFWTWWFWFFYSFFISIFDFLTFSLNEYFWALYLNIILFWISAYLLYKIWELYLEKKYNLFLIILFYLSPILLSFNITILSENIYIPVFLWLILYLLKNFSFVSKSSSQWQKVTIKNLFITSLFLALLYFTRAEAFIYIWSVILVLFTLEIRNSNLWFTNYKLWTSTFKKSLLLISFFLLIISPYLVYLHSITWEWWLTNKWTSNLRQAELRGKEKMDDSWFEQAVWELTQDNHYLKSWFVWWLAYNAWEKWKNLKSYLIENPKETIKRITNNQIKLYTKNIPELIIWDSIKLFYSKDSLFFNNYLFLIFCLIPLFLTIFWIYKLFINKNYQFLIIFFSFFLIASLFFTLFFVLNRYFIIFLPIFLIFLTYWIQNINYKLQITNYKLNRNLTNYILIVVVILVYSLWNYAYYNSIKWEDLKYEVKKIAWEYLKKYSILNTWGVNTVRIMERFPIVTYYSGTKERWLTPYTENLDNLIEYAKYNKIDYLVVDSLDFKTYRPKLNYLLNDNFENDLLIKLKSFQVNNEKVILYKFNF